jgi:hypothetical protein
MNLSESFTLDEFTRSNTAIRKGINNNPTAWQIANLTALCVNVLQPIRLAIKAPMNITSGFRCGALNRAIGGAPNSQHIEGKAADINVDGFTTEGLYQLIKHSGIEFDQCIQEFNQWVHVSYNPGNNRNQCLRAFKKGKATVYESDKS